MKKDDLKSLVTQIYNDTIKKIDSSAEPSKELLVKDLINAANLIQSMSNEQITSLEETREIVAKSYKNIAEQSIASYQKTNCSFEKLTKEHKKVFDKDKNAFINLSSMKDKLGTFHNEMLNEVQQANEVISQLTSEVKRLEKSSNIDSLTQIFNRGALDKYLTSICSKNSLKHELHLLMLDIDDFKKINDIYGHAAGDKVLIFLSNLLRKTLRDGDKLFRYGGEEFTIILNRIENNSCMEITQRILKSVSSNRLIYKGKSLSITVSIGSTVYYDGDTPNELLERADRALYKSKKSGKNQINVELKNGI
ncbi:GGDEF domain-containing protein [Sulfurimonas sp.]